MSSPSLGTVAGHSRDLRGRRVVVLGSTGFLGRHVCLALSAEGARVLQVSRSAPDGPGESRRIELMAASRSLITGLLAGADVVVNAVGLVRGTDEQEMIEVNARFVERLAEAAASQPRPPRLVQLGSAYEYGPTEADGRIAEEWPPAPETVYERSKLAASRVVLRESGIGRLDGVVLRIGNVSGPGAPPESLLGMVASHLAALAGTAGSAGSSAPLRLAPLRAERDFVDARDVADAVLAAARVPALGPADRIINIGRGEAVPVRQLVCRLIALSGIPVPVTEEPGRDGRGQSSAPRQQLDITRARRLLGWRPRRDLDQSLRDLLAAAGAQEDLA